MADAFRVEGLPDLERAFAKAEEELKREFEAETRRIGRRVASKLPTNSGGSRSLEAPGRFEPNHAVLWPGRVQPGQEPRPFILASRVGELGDIERDYAGAVERVLRKVSAD